MGSIPGQGAKILHTVLQGQKKKKKTTRKEWAPFLLEEVVLTLDTFFPGYLSWSSSFLLMSAVWASSHVRGSESLFLGPSKPGDYRTSVACLILFAHGSEEAF